MAVTRPARINIANKIFEIILRRGWIFLFMFAFSIILAFILFKKTNGTISRVLSDVSINNHLSELNVAI